MIRRRWIASLSAAAILAGAVPALAQDSAPKPLLQTIFADNDVSGWKTFGQSAKVSVIKDETRPGTDKNVLQFDYSVAKGDLNAMYLPVNDDEIAAAQSFRFNVKSDYATTLALVLQEKGGGRYIACYHVPAAKWQSVVLSRSDFVLSRDADAPADPDNKLDLDQVEGIASIDLNQVFAQAGDTPLAKLFTIRTGTHNQWFSNFVVGKEIPPGATPSNDPRLDTFLSPQVGWMAIGELDLTTVDGTPLTGHGISASYHQSPDHVAVLMRQIAVNKLVGKTALHITLASDKPARIVIQLEEKGGGKYNTVVSVPGGGIATEFTIKFADLKAADDSKDTDGKFDADQVSQLVMIDLSGLADKADAQNKLYIGDLKLVQ